MKYIYPLALGIALIVVGGAAYIHYGDSSTTTPAAVTTTPIATTTGSGSTTTTTTTTTTTQAPGTYTLAQVALHDSAGDCWTAINGSVYNLTSFIPMHPGGEQILVVCGVDGTGAFEAQHSRTRSAQAELATLKIGTLAQ